MMEEIKVEFYQHDNFVCGRCVEMPEIIRGAGKIIETNGITINSTLFPALYSDALYLRGANVTKDNKWFFLEYCSKEEAKRTIENFQSVINQWNEKNKPILDNIEKEYLAAVIKPFKNKVWSIYKIEMTGSNLAYIKIECQNENDKLDYISFPAFKINTKYRGMKSGVKYTLRELRLE